MTTLTTGDAAQLSGYSVRQIQNLTESGVLIPVEGGDAGGSYRIFSTMQVLGLAFSMQWG